MVAADVPAVTRLLNGYLARFKLTQHFSEEEVAHWWVVGGGGLLDGTGWVGFGGLARGTRGSQHFCEEVAHLCVSNYAL